LIAIMVENEYAATYQDREADTSDTVVAYFNNAGQARLSTAVQAVGVDGIQRDPWIKPPNDQAAVRKLYAQMIKAKETEIAIMPCTAFALTFAARNIERLHDGGRILLLQDQFSSAVYPWQDICKRSDKWALDVVAYPQNGSNWTEEVLTRILRSEDDHVYKVACLPPLHWSDGALLDLPRISQACRSAGITLVVDATQALGAVPGIDVVSIQPSLLVCSVHKWLRGPSGASLVYVHPDLHDAWQPLDQHERARNLDADFDARRGTMGPTGYPEEFVPGARKFDAGGKPNPILLPMLRASLEQVVQLDLVELQERLQTLLEPLLEWASARDDVVVPDRNCARCYHMIGLRPLKKSAQEIVDICDQLAKQDIYLAARCGNLRVSAYLDNTAQDVERLVKGLNNLM
jgi:selenocysteine lyase/cysteine desulfurase